VFELIAGCPAGLSCHSRANCSREPLSSQRLHPSLRLQTSFVALNGEFRMSASVCWNGSSDPRPRADTDVGWNEVSRGLKLVAAGYVAMIGGALLGLFLAWPAISGREFTGARVLSASEEHTSLLIGLIALGVVLVPSFLLIVA